MIASLIQKLRDIDRVRLIGAALAFTAVGALGSLFLIEYLVGYYEAEEEIVYFQSWSDDRSTADAALIQEEERRMRQDAEAMADRMATEALGTDDLGGDAGADAAAPPGEE